MLPRHAGPDHGEHGWGIVSGERGSSAERIEQRSELTERVLIPGPLGSLDPARCEPLGAR